LQGGCGRNFNWTAAAPYRADTGKLHGKKRENKRKIKKFNCKINISTGPRQLRTEQTQVNYTGGKKGK
jgi:hypothetical protein